MVACHEASPISVVSPVVVRHQRSSGLGLYHLSVLRQSVEALAANAQTSKLFAHRWPYLMSMSTWNKQKVCHVICNLNPECQMPEAGWHLITTALWASQMSCHAALAATGNAPGGLTFVGLVCRAILTSLSKTRPSLPPFWARSMDVDALWWISWVSSSSSCLVKNTSDIRAAPLKCTPMWRIRPSKLCHRSWILRARSLIWPLVLCPAAGGPSMPDLVAHMGFLPVVGFPPESDSTRSWPTAMPAPRRMHSHQLPCDTRRGSVPATWRLHLRTRHQSCSKRSKCFPEVKESPRQTQVGYNYLGNLLPTIL